MRQFLAIIMVSTCLAVALAIAQDSRPAAATTQASFALLAPGAKLVELASGFRFTEGPVPDAQGNVYFSDVPAHRIHKWSPQAGTVSLYRENTSGANGLARDAAGNLLACESVNGRVTAIDPNGSVTVVADQYDGKRFNRTNDLWIDPKGGVYFSDPAYGPGGKFQDGEHVFYVTPDRKKVIRVIDDMVRPNGLVGTADGKMLYVADHGASKTWRYKVNPDGTLRDKTLFAPTGSDGMRLDSQGNVYVTTDAVVVYDPSGKQIGRIETPKPPANLCFGGKDRKTLFITARTSVHAIQMSVSGLEPPESRAATKPAGK